MGMNAEFALASLSFMPNRGAKFIATAISSAVANGGFEPEEVITLGIVGAGKLGRAIGGSAADGGWRVLFHDAAVTEPLRTELASSAPTARLTGLAELASQADLIVLAVPFGAADGLDYTLFDGKIVLDAMNHWAPVDGEMPELAAYPQGTSALVAGRGPGMRMVKSLNHLSYHD